MELHKIIKKLQGVMDFDFDERAIFFEKYRNILKSEISANPSNVEAYCLMAMIICELREDIEKSIEILEKCYDQNKFRKASILFHKAFELYPKKSYKYCEAISLLASSNKEEGICQLKSLYSYPFKDEEIDVRIALTFGRELALSGNVYEAKKIAEILLKTEYREFDIEIDEMADFMYILGDYRTCVELYNKYQFLEEASWLNKYFYALKQLGQINIAEKKLQEITEKIEKDIDEEEWNPTYWESYDDYKFFIFSETKRLKDIKEGYNKVFIHFVDILPDTYYDIFYECYYINCPRHHLELIES